MTPDSNAAERVCGNKPDSSQNTENIIRLSEEDFARGYSKWGETGEDRAEFFRRTTIDGKLDAGRTVRSGLAYDYDSTEPVPPKDAERAAKIKGELGDKPLHGIEKRYAYRFVKRAFDIAFSAAVIVLFSWLFLAIAIAVKVDDPKGPVFFKQQRVGVSGVFTMLKFRSMCVDAEEKLANLKELNEKTGPVFKIADDPRITRVGKWIRKLSLDELPQFFNVLVCARSRHRIALFATDRDGRQACCSWKGRLRHALRQAGSVADLRSAGIRASMAPGAPANLGVPIEIGLLRLLKWDCPWR